MGERRGGVGGGGPGGRCMAAHAPEAGGGGRSGPAPAMLSWPLPGCRLDSLTDLFSPRALAELARVAGAAGGAVALDLCGRVLQAPAGGRPGALYLLAGGVPPAGLRSLALRNGTLALRPGMEVVFSSKQPFAVCLEHVKLTRPAPIGKVQRFGGRAAMAIVAFDGPVSVRMVQCRVELSPVGPAGYSVREAAVGICAELGAHVVLEDVDVVARQGAGSTMTFACAVARGARMEVNRCARGGVAVAAIKGARLELNRCAMCVFGEWVGGCALRLRRGALCGGRCVHLPGAQGMGQEPFG